MPVTQMLSVHELGRFFLNYPRCRPAIHHPGLCCEAHLTHSPGQQWSWRWTAQQNFDRCDLLYEEVEMISIVTILRWMRAIGHELPRTVPLDLVSIVQHVNANIPPAAFGSTPSKAT